MTKEAIITVIQSIQVGMSDDEDVAIEDGEGEADAPHEPEVASPGVTPATPAKASEVLNNTVSPIFENLLSC